MNVTKAKLETLFTDELARLQPTPGYMRLLKESVLQIWKARQASVRADLAQAERTAEAIQKKLDRLDEAFLFERSIDIETYDRHAERLREELTLARIAKHSTELDELDVEGILAFAERVLPRAADLWVQAPARPAPAVPTAVLSGGIGVRRPAALLEPPQPHRPSATCGRFRPANERVVDLTGIEPVTS